MIVLIVIAALVSIIAKISFGSALSGVGAGYFILVVGGLLTYAGLAVVRCVINRVT